MKNIIITGAGTGMGLSMTKKFLENDWHVIIGVHNLNKAKNVYQELVQKYSLEKVTLKQVNVGDSESVEKFSNEANAENDHIDAIINNAGIFIGGQLQDLTEEEWDKTMAVDVKSIYLMTKAFILGMIQRRAGSIINIASVAGLLGDYSMPAYNAAKGAVVNLVRSMALDYGPYGIRVNNINPGATNTPMFKGNPETVKQSYRDASPLKRIAEPEEIANVAYFLVSEEASAITGQNIGASMGYGIWSGQPKQ
ncbi:SDR family oxidoreductase [Limosilactobacillus reuteri]|uniref:SDR family oxidoreductase n=1 Tax=Limosilactobacillus reuteri TaxID=1598 RepID=A0A7L6BLH1_LIMRT|nr:SDR family oxidoreductase [Limosilactobacillus reuteri]QLQ62814.1 SDR family oxidoreductase [Limosilactobacillus reuteri]WLC95749.1 SDR family oxidoreductase [Limosilactobacillus reuteri]WRH77895.1 SDR family oxidoreductase [Limosilactobacillus reuteri]